MRQEPKYWANYYATTRTRTMISLRITARQALEKSGDSFCSSCLMRPLSEQARSSSRIIARKQKLSGFLAPRSFPDYFDSCQRRIPEMKRLMQKKIYANWRFFNRSFRHCSSVTLQQCHIAAVSHCCRVKPLQSNTTALSSITLSCDTMQHANYRLIFAA